MPEQLIKGLPEGVELAGDFLPTTANDFELIRVDGETSIYKGARAGSASGMKVKPSQGYVFAQVGYEPLFNIRGGEQRQGRPMFKATKSITPKNVIVKTHFMVDNELDAAALEEALKTIPEMRGYVSMERLDV